MHRPSLASLAFRAAASAVALFACDTSSSGSLAPPRDTSEPDTRIEDTSRPDTTNGDTQLSADPCGGLPLGGRCVNGLRELCVAPTGNGTPRVETFPCVAGTQCVDGWLGAYCEATDECVDGQVECHGTRAAECVGGRWVEEACARGCIQNALDASCRPNVPTARYANTISVEARFPRPDLSDWDPTVQEISGTSLLIASFANGHVLDTTTASGVNPATFDLEVVDPAFADDDDFVVAAPLKVSADGTIRFGVFAPKVGPGEHEVGTFSKDAELWFWAWRVRDIPANSGVVIRLAGGSAAAFVFSIGSLLYDGMQRFFRTEAGTELAIWLGLDATWDCGACMLRAPWEGFAAGREIQNHIFLSGGPDEAYWGTTVLAHEFGHWIMANFGVSPREGGKHLLGIPQHPGLAWSEGFASWFAALMHDDPVYYDKQGGSFFWFDHEGRAYSSGASWIQPNAWDGLEQLITENEVTAMLWQLSAAHAGQMMRLLGSPRMTTSPFLRGYTTRTWDSLNEAGYPLPYWSTPFSAPHLADFFDALICDGAVSPSELDEVTVPLWNYPYPSRSPLCREATIPFETRWDPGATPSVTAAWLVPLEGELRLTLVDLRTDPPTEGPTLVIPGGTPSGEARLAWPDAAPGVEPGLRAETHGSNWGLAGIRPRTPKTPAAPLRTGPEVVLKGRRWGRALPVERATPVSGPSSMGGAQVRGPSRPDAIGSTGPIGSGLLPGLTRR